MTVRYGETSTLNSCEAKHALPVRQSMFCQELLAEVMCQEWLRREPIVE